MRKGWASDGGKNLPPSVAGWSGLAEPLWLADRVGVGAQDLGEARRFWCRRGLEELTVDSEVVFEDNLQPLDVGEQTPFGRDGVAVERDSDREEAGPLVGDLSDDGLFLAGDLDSPFAT